MRRLIPMLVVTVAGLALIACGGSKSSSKSGGDTDAFAELQAIPAQIDEKVAAVLAPVDTVDVTIEQLATLPKELEISEEEFGELINGALAEQDLIIPDSVQGKGREQLTAFLGNIRGFQQNLIGTPAAAKDLLAELAETSTRIPALATEASTSAATTLANPLASKKDKDAARQKQTDAKTLQKQAQARVKAAQDKVAGLPGRAAVAMNRFVQAARKMGVKQNLLRAAKKPVDDAKEGAANVVDTATEGANNAVKDATGQ